MSLSVSVYKQFKKEAMRINKVSLNVFIITDKDIFSNWHQNKSFHIINMNP